MSLSYYSPDLLPYQFFSFPVKILEDIISFKNKWFNFVEGEENEKKRERIEEEKGKKMFKLVLSELVISVASLIF